MAISKIGSKALVDCSVAAVDIEDNSITSAKLAGSIANAKLANSSITVNGTSVSLGASGSIPAVSWQSVITADGSTGTTAVAGNGYFIDTTSAAHTITLPSSPSIGDTVAIKDYAGTFGTNNLTIARNGSNIQGVAGDSSISTSRASLTLVYVDATKGWLYAVESNVAQLVPTFITATGGTVTESGDYKIHTFTGDGCFVVASIGNCISPATIRDKVDYLVVAGGGAGGANGSGGGGAGGFRMSNSLGLPAPTTSPLANPTGVTVSATTYPITVGAGGSGFANAAPYSVNPGSNSIFSTITSAGGGGGGSNSDCTGNQGANGGSGGGGAVVRPASPSNGNGSGNTPPVSPPQGNDGGTGHSPYGPPYSGGGGGGAGAAGNPAPASPTGVGDGGVGSYVSPSFAGCNGTPGPVGSTRYFAGGGGSGTEHPPAAVGSGGAGGGGAGSSTPTGLPADCATANTGGGGGGTGGHPAPSGSGGKGIVILRYKFQ